MFRSRLLALAGTVAVTAAGTIFAATAASASPTPSVSAAFPECLLCWSPRAVDNFGADVAAQVGSGVLQIQLG